MFSSKSFIVSSLLFVSLIHFEFIFVYGIKKCSNFLLLHAQFSQHHFFKACFCLFATDKLAIGARVYLWAFCPFTLFYVSLFVTVTYFLLM